MESGEWLVGASKGVAKARDFRKPENADRWSTEDFDKFGGVPWGRTLGRKEEWS